LGLTKTRANILDAGMLENPELVAAILDDPDDDGPRLVYADWLEERGDPRGTFIRLQCQRERAARDGRRPPAVRKEEMALFGRHALEWLGPTDPKLERVAWARGFPVLQIAARAGDFLQHASNWLSHVPAGARVVLTLTDAHRFGPALAACPELAKVTDLPLGLDSMGLPGLEALLASPHLAGLIRLEVATTSLGDPAAHLVAGAGHLTRLVRLELPRHRIRFAGAQALARAAHLARLRVLDLRDNLIPDAGVRALLESPHLARLRALGLFGNPIWVVGEKLLQARFGHTTSLTPEAIPKETY
jgi:uncharacterized protein (TIGR02996 family)